MSTENIFCGLCHRLSLARAFIRNTSKEEEEEEEEGGGGGAPLTERDAVEQWIWGMMARAEKGEEEEQQEGEDEENGREADRPSVAQF